MYVCMYVFIYYLGIVKLPYKMYFKSCSKMAHLWQKTHCPIRKLLENAGAISFSYCGLSGASDSHDGLILATLSSFEPANK